MDLVEIIETETENILFKYAVSRGDGFRQWFYPRLPRNYDVNPDVAKLATEGMLKGRSAQQIADDIYADHS